MRKRPKSKVLASVQAAAKALHEVNGIDKQTMRQYDALCLEPVKPLSGAEIRALREREHASQAVFARRLNTTAGLVSKWEREEKQPSGPALKLLGEVRDRAAQARRAERRLVVHFGFMDDPKSRASSRRPSRGSGPR